MITGSQTVARTLFLLSCQAKSGTLHVEMSGAVGRLVVDGGWVHALANLGPRRDRGEEMLVLWLRALNDDSTARFEETPPRDTWGRVPPFHPARILREHFEALAGLPGRPTRPSTKLRLQVKPHSSCLDPDEVGTVRLLDGTRGTVELLATGVTKPVRLARLIAFLDEAGILEGEGGGMLGDNVSVADAFDALGLPPGSGAEEVRRAYHRLARTLHPDMHPRATSDEKKALEDRLHRVSAAYRRIVG